MNYRSALASLYVLLVATVAAVIVLRLNPAIISAVAIPFVTLPIHEGTPSHPQTWRGAG